MPIYNRQIHSKQTAFFTFHHKAVTLRLAKPYVSLRKYSK